MSGPLTQGKRDALREHMRDVLRNSGLGQIANELLTLEAECDRECARADKAKAALAAAVKERDAWREADSLLSEARAIQYDQDSALSSTYYGLLARHNEKCAEARRLRDEAEGRDG